MARFHPATHSLRYTFGMFGAEGARCAAMLASRRPAAAMALRSCFTRGLCSGSSSSGSSSSASSASGMQEPSEATSDPAVPPQLRAKDILAAKKEGAREYGKYQRHAATLGCASLSASGAGLLAHQHFEFLQPYLLDIMGFGLLGAAAIIGKEVFGKKSTPAPKKGGWQYKLVPLHDEARYATAVAALSVTAGKDKALSPAGPLDEALAAAEKAQAEKAEEAKAERSAVLLKEVKVELAAGAAPRRVRQRLAPRVFVIDFDTRGPARGGGDAQPPKAPPNMRAMLETLREQVGLLLHVASPYDEVVLRVTSPGGSVMDYGLAAALFARLKAAGVRTTACVDLVAA